MRVFLLYLFMILSIAVDAQEINVKTWFDTSTVYIGDQIFYNIEINQPEELHLSVKYPSDTLVNKLLIVSRSGPDTIAAPNTGITILSKHLVTSFDSGNYEIPPFFVEFFDGEKRVRYYSDYARLDVIRTTVSPADSTEMFDIIGPYHEKVRPVEVLPWAILILFLIIVGWIVYNRIKARKRDVDNDQISKIPQEPLHIIILRDLDKLDRMELWQKGKIKEFYSRLTEILRYFLELKYKIPALEMTTSEIMEAIRKGGFISGSSFNQLKEILAIADMSKFAKYTPVSEVNSTMILRSKDFVNNCCKISPEQNITGISNNPEEVSYE